MLEQTVYLAYLAIRASLVVFGIPCFIRNEGAASEAWTDLSRYPVESYVELWDYLTHPWGWRVADREPHNGHQEPSRWCHFGPPFPGMRAGWETTCPGMPMVLYGVRGTCQMSC
jgi:hypothetical protein